MIQHIFNSKKSDASPFLKIGVYFASSMSHNRDGFLKPDAIALF